MRDVSLAVTRSRPTVLWLWFAVVLVAASAAIVISLTLAGGSEVYRELDRGVPGEFTSVLSASLELVATLASTLAIGGLVFVAFLRAPVGRNRLLVDGGRDLAVVRIAAIVWASAAVLLIAVDAADSNGQPVSRLLHPGAFAYLFQASYSPGAWLVAAICAFLVFVFAVFMERWQACVVVLGIGILGALAPVLVGQVLVGPNHDFGGDATIIGLPALSIWFGASAVMLFRRLRGEALTTVSLRRFAWLSVACWAIVLGEQVVVALFELAGSPPFASPTGIMFTAQFAILIALVPLGSSQFGWLRHPPDEHRGLRVGSALGTLALMAVYLSLSVAMSRFPPPQFFVPTTTQDLFFGYNIPDPPTVLTLLADWRINILFFVPAVAAAALYAVGVIRLHRRGDRWSPLRTTTWMLGCLVVILTTSSAVGPYASASFSMHMIFHMSLNMLGPLLLVMGGPITLALRATTARDNHHPAGPHEWINAMLHWSFTKKLYNPLLVFIEFIGSYYLIYFTPIFGWAMRYHWAHQLMNVHFLIVGYMFYSLVIGIDRPPRPLPYIGKLGLVLAAMPFHAFFGVIVMTSDTVIGQLFYQYIHVPWITDLHEDQILAGGIAWAAGELPLIVVVIALVTQWAGQDRREAVRQDRHFDRGLDSSFDAYNEMLAKLAERTDAGSEHRQD